jgi:hypothetical protein
MDYVRYLDSLPPFLTTPFVRNIAEEKQKQQEFYCNEFLSSFRQAHMRNHEDALQLVMAHMQKESQVA